MPGDVLMALAQFAGQTVAAAAITDMWEGVIHGNVTPPNPTPPGPAQ